jgi:ABC-type multidrug transport system ATPase subunit
MEEADALSDRIAILNRGQLKCVGSPHFLKKLYGNGFRIKVIKNAKFEWTQFDNFLEESSFVEYFKIESNYADQIEFSISFDLMDILAKFLAKIEAKKEELGLDSYSVSSLSLEEVFLKLVNLFLKIILS